MSRDRILAVVVLLPVFLLLVYLGGWAFTLAAAAFLAIAAWEYNRLMRLAGHAPAVVLLVGGTAALAISRGWIDFAGADFWIAGLTLAAMTHHLLDYERGRDRAATDFAVTLGGLLYIGWLGAYFISVRRLPDGLFWLLLALPSVWLADSGAYSIGRRWGKHRLSPRLSPKKTWEGYLAGIVYGTIGGAALGWIWSNFAGSIDPLNGALLGLVLSVVTTLGDLGESMFKRQVGEKDSSHLIPGHGGAMDRIDSWLWAVVIAYYLIPWIAR